MAYKTKFIEHCPVGVNPDGSFRFGTLAVVTTTIAGEPANALIPIPQEYWESHETYMRTFAKERAASLFLEMKRQQGVGNPLVEETDNERRKTHG